MCEPNMLNICLAVVKFTALGIATVSGAIATFTKTKDETTGKVTRGGKTLIVLIVVSFVASAITQSIEIHQKEEIERTDRAHRLQELEALYKLTRPLGNLQVQVNVTYPVTTGISGLDADWLNRVRRSMSTPIAVLNEQNNPLRPRQGDESAEFGLLVEPEFLIILNRSPTQTGSDGVHLHDHGAELMFRTTTADISRIRIQLLKEKEKIDSQIYAPTIRVIDNGSIMSWRDLYGAEVIIELPQTAPVGTRITRCVLMFSTGAKVSSRRIEVPLTDGDRRTNPVNEAFSNISYVRVLNKAELGPKPQLLQAE